MKIEFENSKSKLEFLDVPVCKEKINYFFKKSAADRQNYLNSKSEHRKPIKSQAHDLKEFSHIVDRGFLTPLFYLTPLFSNSDHHLPPPHTHIHSPTKSSPLLFLLHGFFG